MASVGPFQVSRPVDVGQDIDRAACECAAELADLDERGREPVLMSSISFDQFRHSSCGTVR